MVERDKNEEQRSARSVLHAHGEQLRENFSASVQKVGRFSGQVGEFSERAAGILTRRDARSIKIRLTLTALFVSVLALVIASVGNYYSLPHSPEEAAEQYIQALQRGDYIDGLDEEAYRSFTYTYLTNTIYSSAQGRVESYTILSSAPEPDDHAEVTVRALANGQEHDFVLPFVLEPRSGPFNDTWKLATSAQNYLQLTTPVDLSEITVNGHSLSLPKTRRLRVDGGYSWLVPLLPGAYTVSLPSTSYYVLSPVERTVTSPLPDGSNEISPLNLEVRPSPRMWRETDELIDSWLSRCESSRRLDVVGCPTSAIYGNDSTVTISDVQWKLVSRPAFYLVQDTAKPSLWHASEHEQAVMDLTYLADGKAQREIITFTIDAEVVSDGNHADISVGLGDKKTSREELQESVSDDVLSQPTLQQFAATS
ncbi:hypothetical protein ACN082_10125 [Rothia sp. CCM 9417]|uniref:hypothetical protein n=1 Tax=Rothia sp. CCM 9417 TaxID=3402657 RepID=UPI003AE4CB99